jgi:hypothetical protein
MIEYIDRGNVLNPVGEGRKIICHCCNNLIPGVMGAGVALALRKKWSSVYDSYVEWSIGKLNKPYELGEVQFIKVESDILVANMIGQEGTGFRDGKPPVRYEALEKCLNSVKEVALKYSATVHIPYLLGCDLAGGNWDIVSKMFEDILVSNGVKVTAYDFLNKRNECSCNYIQEE